MDALKKGAGIPLQNYDVYIYIVAELIIFIYLSFISNPRYETLSIPSQTFLTKVVSK